MQADPDAWRGTFRKMAASAFAFYRGSAALFYTDIADDKDPFLDAKTSRIWIHGDLHAENFGTYMNSAGILCVSDSDSDQTLAPFSTEEAIHAVVGGHTEDFVASMVAFGADYGAVVRKDHTLFIDAFRNHQFPGL